MIESFIGVVREIPYDRCQPLIGLLLEGVPLSDAIALASFPPHEASLLSKLQNVSGGDSVQLGTDLRLIYGVLSERKDTAEVVWTGPPSVGGGAVRATFPVARALISTAKTQLLIAGYVAQIDVLEKLGLRGALRNGASVILLMDDLNLDDPAMRTMIAAGVTVIDASPSRNNMSKFHAKVIVADRCRALVTSANFTHLGQSRNIELGLQVTGEPAEKIAALLERYANSLLEARRLQGAR